MICVPPHWFGSFAYRQQDLEREGGDRYIQILQDVNKRHDCMVILCNHFGEITPEGTDEDYLFDKGHMTEKGAQVFSRYITDKMLESHKAAQALRNSAIK